MDAMAFADVTATATLVLAGITLVLAMATVALVVVTRHGTAQARSDARAELMVLERQLRAGYRPLLVDVIRSAPVLPDMSPRYNVSREEGTDRRVEYPGPVVETKFPGHQPVLFDPRAVFVSFEAEKIYISVPLRNVGRGLAVIDSGGVEVRGPFLGPVEHRMLHTYHVPVGETTRVDLITGYLREQASDPAAQEPATHGIVWELIIPYCDFAGGQRTLARLQIGCRDDDVGGPWLVERVAQESVGDESTEVEPSTRTDARRERVDSGRRPVTDLWGDPVRPRRPRR